MRIQFFIIVIALIIAGCHKDSGFEDKKVSQDSPIQVLGEKNGSIMGYVYDDMNRPVSGAQVTIYNAETVTDIRGVFEFEDVNMDPHGTLIQIRKSGYLEGSDKVFPTSAASYSSIQLITLDRSKTFESSEGGVVEAKFGGSVIFEPNTIYIDDDTPYDGPVYVTAQFLSPEYEQLGDIMPGDLQADDALTRTRVLTTAGMMAVDIRNEEGRELVLNGTALLKIPYTSDNFPSEIPLWSYDEDKGRWQEEGQAALVEGFYEAEVSHFSFWNCDVPYPLINLCGKVLTEDGVPVRTAVYITVDGIGTGHGYTDSNGEFCGKVPKGEMLEIKVSAMYCNEVVVSQEKGPFDNDVIIDDIVIENFLPNIAGEVLCQGDPYGNATVFLRTVNREILIGRGNMEDFNFNINTICSGLDELSITAYDNATNLSSGAVSVDQNGGGFYPLEVCLNPCDFDVTFSNPCDSDSLDVTVVGGTGDYSFDWSTGENGSVIQLPAGNSNTYCVTVTEELSGCTLEFCQEAVASRFSLELTAEPCFGLISGFITGGVGPFDVIPTDGGQPFTVDNNFFDVSTFNSGLTCFDVVDVRGCMIQECVEAFFEEPPFIESRAFTCQEFLYSFNGTEYESGFLTDDLGNSWPMPPYPAQINVLEVGFSFKRAVLYNFNGCQGDYDIRVPFFEGLQDPEIVNTSCDTCNDGAILPLFDANADCFECTFMETKVINQANQNVTDLAQGELGQGVYRVVAVDSVGCYIASRLAQVQ